MSLTALDGKADDVVCVGLGNVDRYKCKDIRKHLAVLFIVDKLSLDFSMGSKRVTYLLDGWEVLFSDKPHVWLQALRPLEKSAVAPNNLLFGISSHGTERVGYVDSWGIFLIKIADD